jgi:hypothetical protein
MAKKSTAEVYQGCPELDLEEQAYADCLARKLRDNPEAEYRDFDTGCGMTIRVHKNGQIEQR